MLKSTRRRTRKVGMPAGSLVYVGDKQTEAARLTLIHYDRSQLEEKQLAATDQFESIKKSEGVAWFNIDGVDHADLISRIGQAFGIHALVLEDIMNTSQRPKQLLYDGYIFMVFKMLCPSEQGQVHIEQVSLVLGENFLLSFQEESSRDVFDKVRENLRKGGQIRSLGPDYLAYALLDTVVDHYFVILERLGERLEDLEHQVMTQPSEEVLKQIHATKRELITIRRCIWPMRELVGGLGRGDLAQFKPATQLYLRDVYDHVIETIEILEMFRDMAQSLLDIYLSSINNRINQVMKMLAMVATIFMPLTLISSIYGMNFEHMPELKWEFGYPLSLALMGTVCLVMLGIFRRKGWL